MRIESLRRRRDRTRFIGRTREREAIHAALDRGVGLISLVGSSGIGKTHLARQVAAERSEIYESEGGAWFCSLAGCRDAADLELAVARTLELSDQQGADLARSIANRGLLLLILDNADAIVDQIGGVLERWLERCVELQILLTSLTPARIAEETILELRPLEPGEAVALYLERAHRAWADRSFSPDDAEVQELVRRLDHLPLAIELAAARVRVLPPRAMLSMFDKRFELLRTNSLQPGSGPRDPQPRRGSLLDALELTWSHLDPAEQGALMRGAVFEGGFTAEAARAMDEEGEEESGAILESLHRRSLILREELDPPRYFLVESVKEFALRELRARGGWEATIRRHASFFLQERDREPLWSKTLAFGRTLAWLRRERENLLVIYHRFRASDPALEAEAGLALAPLILAEGPPSSQLGFIEATLEAARRCGRAELLIEALEVVNVAQFRQGHFDACKAAMDELVELARGIGDRAMEAYTLTRQAIFALERKSLDRAHEFLQRADELNQELDQPALAGAILQVRGTEAVKRGAFDEAAVHLVRAVELLRRHGRGGSEVNALFHLGFALANQREHVAARKVMREAIDACRAHELRTIEAHVRHTLGTLELAAGFLDEAQVEVKAGLTIQRDIGNPFREGVGNPSLGIISLERGDLERAEDYLSRAEELLREKESSKAYPVVLIFLAALEAKRQQLREARRLLGAAIQAREKDGGESEGISLEYELLFEGAEGLLEVVGARCADASEWSEAQARIERARRRLSALKEADVPWPSYVPVLTRLLERELESWDAGIPIQAHRPRPTVLRVGAEHDWFQLPDRDPISLRSRRVIRRIFGALVRGRLERPGEVVSFHELIREGWPDVEDEREFSLNRLYFGVWTLRDLGLRSIVQSTDAGYCLDPSVPILQVREDASAPGDAAGPD